MTADSTAYHPHYLHNEHALAAMLELGQVELTKLAEEGEPYASIALGSKYLRGADGLERDLAKGFQYYLKAAEQGLAFAQILVGQHYRDGEGVTANQDDAKRWFQKAALQHAPPAMHELALFHMDEGRLNDALELLHEASELGFSASQFQLANLYEYDKTIGQNYPEAFKWISLAAAENDDAKFHLAQMLRSGLGCDDDPVAALIICEELAEQGHVEGAFACGTMHWTGDGTVQDIERGARYIEWAAEQNLPEAHKWLAELKHERKPAFDFREEYEIDDWLNMAAPSETALQAILPFASYVDDSILKGRTKLTSDFGVLSMDSRLPHYQCDHCRRRFSASVIKHLPKVTYNNWAELINWLHIMLHVDFDDSIATCPQCGEAAEISAVDLHVFNSDLQRDLVLRTIYSDMDNVPNAYKAFSWDEDNGYQVDITEHIDEESFAVDALVRRLALLHESGDDQSVKCEVISVSEAPDRISTLLDTAVLFGGEEPFPWLGMFICQLCIDRYPSCSEAYTAMAACHLNAARGHVDDAGLVDVIEKLLLTAISLDPENEIARNFLKELREST